MNTYLLYPGCSLQSTGRGYEESLRAVFNKLDIELRELPDWNCCGATAYASIDETQAFCLTARNLAIAEMQSNGAGDLDVIAPCSACFLALTKTQRYMATYPHVKERVHKALATAGLKLRGRTRVRHPLDVIVNDIGLDIVKEKVTSPLNGQHIACYYGCQVVRPFETFDSSAQPVTMDLILNALGAKTVDWSLKTHCCGGSLTGTIPDAGLPLNRMILKEAIRRDADMIATCCPLCQFNLECLQNTIIRKYKEDLTVPVVYFTQLMGMAFGLDERALGLHRVFVKPRLPDFEREKGGVKAHA